MTQFTKYDGEISPTNFLATLSGELDLEGLNTEANKLKYLPLTMKGKATYYADVIRGLATWAEAEAAFITEFTTDPNVIMGELRALRTVEYDVNKYSDQFQSKI